MDYDPRDGVFHQKLREDFEMPCKRCGATVVEADPQCWKCGIKFPGIYSSCPECQSANFEIKRKGANLVRGVASGLFFGPVGFFNRLMFRECGYRMCVSELWSGVAAISSCCGRKQNE